jgi:hypothetical protein
MVWDLAFYYTIFAGGDIMNRRPSAGLRRVLADERFEQAVKEASHQRFTETDQESEDAGDGGAVFLAPEHPGAGKANERINR